MEFGKMGPLSIVVVCLCVAALRESAEAKSLPSYVPICKRNDKNLNDCFKKATQVIRPYITKGIPELNIPPIDPLMIPMVMLEQGTPAVNYKAKLKNLKVFGLRNYMFDNVMIDLTKLQIMGRINIPMIWLEADYDIKGRALVLPIQGNGLFKANLTTVTADVKIETKLIKKKGEDYLEPKSISTKFNIEQATADFANLFNGDETLSRTTNQFLNDNAKDIVEEVKPAIEAVIAMLAEDIGGKVFATTSFNKLFPK
ncbi:hypothetical protein LSTR_LSTR012323 [Laodelphax striatellus]|uniref:Uncharacterized protein n=1 Tax=Laodelphax striatellus TaxID=195883 RepID=A0A482WSW3_LAOST|nr:hypothetical protein LSTR_LSTR012323 [Laodelphax striatellus]